MEKLGILTLVFVSVASAQTCENSPQYDGRCDLFKKNDFCAVTKDNKYVGFMSDHCKKTCAFCAETDDCSDSKSYVSLCPTWKSSGFCEISATNSYYGFMTDHCKKTCGFCIDKCRDSEKYASSCPVWKDYCKQDPTNTYYTFMMDHCKRTCRKCGATVSNVTCGMRPTDRGRVIGGRNASANSWPWQVALIYNDRFVCGGTLVGSDWVLTAAHCVFGLAHDAFRITLGEHDREAFEGPEQNIGVSSTFVHPKYDPNTYRADIALMKLSRPAVLNSYVTPACLPKEDSTIATNKLCYITGWGKIVHPGPFYRFLQQAEVPVVSRDVCQRENNPFGLSLNVTEDMVCAGDGGLKSGCHGDSGGPFVCADNDRWTVHGAVSWGSASCNAKLKHTVFARVSKFVRWIEETRKLN